MPRGRTRSTAASVAAGWTAPLDPPPGDGGIVPGRHVIADIRYRDEWVLCSCGAVVTAAPDPYWRDSHGPLVDAWQQHRASVAIAKAVRRRGRPFSLASQATVAAVARAQAVADRALVEAGTVHVTLGLAPAAE